MIDIHNHIIAGIDDGAVDIEESEEMLRQAEKDGAETIFATPHYMIGRYEPDFDTVKAEVNKLKQLVREKDIRIDIACGQEVMLENSIIDKLYEGKIRGLNESRYMLVEFPMDKLPEDASELLYELRVRNYVPVLAHPERYKYIIDKPSEINRFIEEGCLFQLNSGSVTGKFGKEVKNVSEILIKNGLCSFIASDAHGSKHRTPYLKEAIEFINNEDEELLLRIYKNLAALMQDKEIKYDYEKILEKKKVFSFFNRR